MNIKRSRCSIAKTDYCSFIMKSALLKETQIITKSFNAGLSFAQEEINIVALLTYPEHGCKRRPQLPTRRPVLLSLRTLNSRGRHIHYTIQHHNDYPCLPDDQDQDLVYAGIASAVCESIQEAMYSKFSQLAILAKIAGYIGT